MQNGCCGSAQALIPADPFQRVWLPKQIFLSRDPKGHINRRILHSGSKAQYKGDTRNQVL